jgi:beta-lactamase class A
MYKTKITVLIILAIIALLLGGFFHFSRNNKTPFDDEPISNNETPIIEPEPEIKVKYEPDIEPEPEVIDLQILEDRINDYLTANNIDTDLMSYKITDLESNETIGLNSEQEFISASIYKLPIAMLYYDGIEEGIYSYDDHFLYEGWMSEVGGPVYDYYYPGEYLPLDYLLNVMIEQSGNTSAHILYGNLGGWEASREMALKYTDRPAYPQYFAHENYLTAEFTNDLLLHIYDNQEKYERLLIDMSNAQQDQYLNYNMHHTIPQKTGNNSQGVGSVGIMLENHPYTISFLSHFEFWNAHEIMGEISEITYNFFIE